MVLITSHFFMYNEYINMSQLTIGYHLKFGINLIIIYVYFVVEGA